MIDLTAWKNNGVLAPITQLIPLTDKSKPALPPHYTQKLVTIVGLKTTAARFMPVSHEGDSNETYVDKVENLRGTNRAEFIARKLKATERRAHMRLFRELTEKETGKSWQTAFEGWFKRACEIPNGLCTLCWNDSLFGSLEAGKGATFARIRYFDTYSIESSDDCVAQTGSEEGMAVGNTVGEDLSKGRGDASLHYYEYVKPGTHFPFITIIENPTMLDIAGLLNAITLADLHGHGKYSANHGKFDTEIFAVSTGVPRFSILDMLDWAAEGVDKLRNDFKQKAVFESPFGGEVLTLRDNESDVLRAELAGAFKEYVNHL
jgi:CRISPR type I-D-associated protein Csc2